ncbi:MBL fold metallo-hydrolase [Sulfobacillus thermosulfidooxidans]|uniref:MBL fold metallo-hydrolase n=1 Tax=Sulfobacillus thermosulfidooxidans TaxID=28034 RepID=UPI00096BC368|nr:MBL fold metallo-hydrolase [Sulfobacillus thermosulfidooxidans]OLZ11731.1 MBL fold metallo-hydrolase [Sulfobacillus thermosulfidooxidans]OLZ18694.1 MBL fold metallo-hydrolase [Sulfobacillus thermosulfidooxidans]OLZ20227.1 MBL fold metallo-hydrolase [Sulfobacillus thermosulfidooxidans]
MSIIDYGQGIYAIDLYEEGKPFRSSAYVIKDNQTALIETGSARSHEALLQGLKELDLSPADLDHVIVTHVHLDHAGGAGQMMQRSPHALLHAHPRAARHLIDPSKLDQGARAVYGDHMDEMFGALVPVDASRVVIEDDEGTLSLGEHTLSFYHTPGHAKHHMCIVDDVTQGIFSGDMIGIRYVPGYTGWDFDYGFPTTSPVDFDPDVMLQSLDRLEALGAHRIYHTHFGVTEPAQEAFDFSRKGVHYINELIKQLPENPSYELVYRALSEIIAQDLKHLGHPVNNVDPLALDIMLDSQGILVYIQKKKAGKL